MNRHAAAISMGDHRGMRVAIRQVGNIVAILLPWAVGAFYIISAIDWLGDDSGIALIVALVLAVTQGTALVWRREHPELVALVVLGAGLPFHLLIPELVIPFAGLAAIWSLALARPPRLSLIGLAGLLALSSANFFTTTVDDAVFTMAIAAGVWALGEAARNRRVTIEEASRRAVSEERARIARELHDVIAHSVSVIVIQAAAAGDVFDARPDQARAALQSIEDTGRDTLRELRLLLSAVRPEGEGSPAPPQPGLERLDELAEPLRAAGLKVVVTHERPLTALPAGVDVSAYRIVQEALTNTMRHAAATLVEVTIRYNPEAVEIDVVDDGRAAAGRAGAEPGYGLVGMRERAALLDGTLDAGPTAHGGYRVHARLPLDVRP